ncbi:Putative single-stranded DNA binding protein [Arachis hypogaea]|nr:Putative single-stranded DNA binding protein [Arachis hypogaea]
MRRREREGPQREAPPLPEVAPSSLSLVTHEPRAHVREWRTALLSPLLPFGLAASAVGDCLCHCRRRGESSAKRTECEGETGPPLSRRVRKGVHATEISLPPPLPLEAAAEARVLWWLLTESPLMIACGYADSESPCYCQNFDAARFFIVDPPELLAAAGAVAEPVQNRSCFVSLVQNEKRFSWDPNRVAKVEVLGEVRDCDAWVVAVVVVIPLAPGSSNGVVTQTYLLRDGCFYPWIWAQKSRRVYLIVVEMLCVALDYLLYPRLYLDIFFGGSDWYYASCKSCPRKVKENKGHYLYKHCGKVGFNAPLRYRLHIIATDGTGCIGLIIWNQEAKLVVGKSASEVKDLSRGENVAFKISDDDTLIALYESQSCSIDMVVESDVHSAVVVSLSKDSGSESIFECGLETPGKGVVVDSNAGVAIGGLYKKFYYSSTVGQSM